MSDCQNKFITNKNLQDPRITEAYTAMYGRLRMLGIFAIFVLILIYFIIIFITTIYDSIAHYYSMTDQKNDYTSMNGRAAISLSIYDNEEYDEMGDEEIVNEYNEYKRSMAKIKTIYADYNEKVSVYQRSLDKEPTDVIDEKLMLKEFDNY